MFNLGPQELIILMACFGLPAIAGVIILVVVLTTSGKKNRDD